jgi:hypothetical protein
MRPLRLHIWRWRLISLSFLTLAASLTTDVSIVTEVAVANRTNDLVGTHLRACTQATEYSLQPILFQNTFNRLFESVNAVLLDVARHEAIMDVRACN